MADEYRNRVAQRAYALWEREGRPEGREHHHWAEAERQIAAEGARAQPTHGQPAPAARGGGAPAAPKPKPRKTAAASSRRTAAREALRH